VRDALQLEGKDRDRYSWNQVAHLRERIDTLARMASMREHAQRSAVERDILRLATAWFGYRSMHFALVALREESMDTAPPSADFWKEKSGISEWPLTFIDFVKSGNQIIPLLDSLERVPNDSLQKADKEFLMWIGESINRGYAWSQERFPVVPLIGAQQTVWESPGALVFRDGAGFLKALTPWQDMRKAWITQDEKAFANAATTLWNLTSARTPPDVRKAALSTELTYNRLDPFYKALILYFFALLPLLWAMRKKVKRKNTWIATGTLLLSLAWVLQVIGMGLRMHITLRPPVTNMYETFVFVAATAVPLLLWMGKRQKWPAAYAASAFSGAAMLLIARRYGMDGDTMPVLVAVLDSNFWLTVHVITITLGYGGIAASGVAAHFHLWQWKKNDNPDAEKNAFLSVRNLQAFGLLFTFIGTLLGGVWADQSWGRFWGWDPKENGALLIVLWSAVLFHAMPAGWIQRKGFSLGAVFGIAVVLFAWLGVNLLGVGLHSYGFTEGTFNSLLAYVIVEILFVVWVWKRRPAKQ
jgi:ABC-type transport system involved in cytochrome c biogenesis permease subunit